MYVGLGQSRETMKNINGQGQSNDDEKLEAFTVVDVRKKCYPRPLTPVATQP